MKLFSGKKLNCLIAITILMGVVFPFCYSLAQTTATSAIPQDSGEDQSMKFGVSGWLAKWIVYPILLVLIEIMKLFLEISGKILNWVLSPDFNRLPLTRGGIVDIGWAVLRDFANMFIVIILIVIGFATILKIETYGVKKLLPKLVLVALLINFSKVIAGVVVDSSQIFMLYFLSPIHDATKDSGGAVLNLFKGAQLHALLSTLPKEISESTHVSEGIYKAASAAFVVVFLALAAVAFFYLAIILVTRIIYIWILVIVSPLAWVASIIPQGQSYWKKWWTRFLRECFLGVVIAFFVWMAIYLASMLTLISRGEPPKGSESLSSALSPLKGESITYTGGNAMFGDMSLMLIYVVVIAFLYIAVHIARTQSNELAKFAIDRTTNIGKSLMGMAGGLARGGARAGLQGVRRKMQERMEGSQWLQNHPKVSKLLNIVPGLGLGARMGAKIEAGKEVDEQKRLLVAANIPPEQLAQLSKGAVVTKDGRRRKAAAIELLAEKNLLTATGVVATTDANGVALTADQIANAGRQLAETIKRLGGNANAIFKSRPDWLDDPIKITQNIQRRTGADKANFDVAALDNTNVLAALTPEHWKAISASGSDVMINKVLSKLATINQTNSGLASDIAQSFLHGKGYFVDPSLPMTFTAPVNPGPGNNITIDFTDRNLGAKSQTF